MTLIMVAQIMQPDDEVGVGRCPGKRLKSLFKKMMASVQSEPASQGAGTARTEMHDAGKSVHHGEAVSNPAHGDADKADTADTNPTAAKPKILTSRLNLDRFNVSMSGMAKAKRKEAEKTGITDEKKTDESNAFTVNDLRLQWLAMCNRMEAANMVGMAKRLKNIIPNITEYPQIELVVDNEMLRDEIHAIKNRLELTMAKYLHNGSLTLNIRVAEPEERQKILTPKENFLLMMEKSEGLKVLVSNLRLEME